MNTTIQTTVLKGDWFSYYFMFICVDITALRCCFYALYDNKETFAGLDCTINSNFNKKHTATWVKECFGMNQVFVSSQVTSAGWNSETYHRSHTVSMPQRPGEALFSFCWVVVFFFLRAEQGGGQSARPGSQPADIYITWLRVRTITG